LVDGEGKQRALLQVVEGAVNLSMKDENGRVRLGMIVAADGPAVDLYDERQTLRAALQIVRKGPILALSPSDGRPTITVSATPSGPEIVLWHNDRPRAGARVDNGRPSFDLLDSQGRVIWQPKP
jgi:hypothetical protein